MIWTKTEARQLIDRVLSFSKADDCAVTISSSDSSHTRYANNEITTSGDSRNVSINITSTIDKRSGRVSVNELSEVALKRAVARAEEIARISPPDPDYVEPLGPQQYPEIPAFFDETARARATDRLSGVRAVIEPAAKQGLQSSGFFTNTATALAFGNTRKNFGYHRSTQANYSATVRTPDGTGSGWSSAASPRIGEIDTKRLAETAIRKAVDSRAPKAIEPGRYTVVLEPAAVNDLIPQVMGGFNARQAEQGFGFLSKRGGSTLLGEKVFGDLVSIRSDPFDPRLPGAPWSGDGPIPSRKVSWVEKGVIKTLAYDRTWARQAGREPVSPGNFIMEGGTATLDELIQSTKRGLLVTHFWYIRSVNPQIVQLTGLTRDGLFLIEDGRIKMPVTNLRFNESPVQVLKNVEALGQAVRTGSGLEAGSSIVPAIKASNFFFSSISDAV